MMEGYTGGPSVLSVLISFAPTLFSGNWFSFAQSLLDPFDLWFSSVFGGRPKLGPDSATDNVAVTLLESRNPYVRWWGFGVRVLEAKGIPISISDVNVWKQTYGRLQDAALRDLNRQMPEVMPDGRTAGWHTWVAFRNLAYSRKCNASSRDPECPIDVRRIDLAWYIPLVKHGSGRPPSSCVCTPAARG